VVSRAVEVALMHAHTYAHTHLCTHTLMHTHTYALAPCTHTLMHRHTYAQTHLCTDKLMHTHTYAHTHLPRAKAMRHRPSTQRGPTGGPLKGPEGRGAIWGARGPTQGSQGAPGGSFAVVHLFYFQGGPGPQTRQAGAHLPRDKKRTAQRARHARGGLYDQN